MKAEEINTTKLPYPTPLSSGAHDSNDIVRLRTELVREFPLFSQIPTEDCAKIVAAARDRSYPRDRTIYFEGDPVKHVILLTSGCMKLLQTGSQGQEVILRLVGPGESLCADCFPNHSHGSTAQTMEPSTALVWEASQFQAFTKRFPALDRNICCALKYTLNQLEVRFREICTEKVAPRLVNQLVRLINQVGKRTDDQVEIGLSQRDLAQLTGTNLFTVNRILGQWQELGIVEPKREVLIILNLTALEEISRGGRTGLKLVASPQKTYGEEKAAVTGVTAVQALA